jgi:hypothetical protein
MAPSFDLRGSISSFVFGETNGLHFLFKRIQVLSIYSYTSVSVLLTMTASVRPQVHEAHRNALPQARDAVHADVAPVRLPHRPSSSPLLPP